MIDPRHIYPGDECLVFLVSMAFFAVSISAITLIATLPLWRQPAMRHGALLTGLICVAVLPIPVIRVGTNQQSLLDVMLPFPVEAPSRSSFVDRSVSAVDSVIGSSENLPVVSANGDVMDASATQPGHRDMLPENFDGQTEMPHRTDSIAMRPAWFCVLASLLCLTWVVGSVIFSVRYLRASTKLVTILRRTQPIPEDAYPTARAEAMLAMNIGQLPNIAVSNDIRTPVVMGAFQPRIVVPESLLNMLSEAQIHDILVHETAHAVRRDLWVVQLEALATIMFWPIPLVRLLIHELDRAREELCDLHVLKTRQRRDYGQTLLRIARLTDHAQPLALATGILPKPGRLESRVARLLSFDRDESTKTSWLVVVGIWLGFLLLTSIVCGTRLMAM
jgi:beta-lactamase regulating signal transducer with metallopeptidase domain